MKQLLTVIEVTAQRTFQTQRGENMVATGLWLKQGRDQFYGEAYGQQAVGLPEEDKTSYLIRVSGSNYKTNTMFIDESGHEA